MAQVISINPADALRQAGPVGRGARAVLARTGRRFDQLDSSTIALLEAATVGVRNSSPRLADEPSGLDDWGRSPKLVRNAMMVSRLRWSVTTGGADRLPKKRGAMIVINAPAFTLTPIFASLAISEAIGRPVRFVGRADDDLVGAVARRLGGLIDDPEEVAGALRDNQVVVAAANRKGRDFIVDHTITSAAVATSTRVFPAAAVSSALRRARVEIGPSMRPSGQRRGPLAELELADRAGERIGELLDELGGYTGFSPAEWLRGVIQGEPVGTVGRSM